MRSSAPRSTTPQSAAAPTFERPMMGSSKENSRTLAFVLILIVTLLAEGLALNAEFFMDDFMHIVNSETVIGNEWNPSTFRTLPYLVYRGIYSVAGPSPFAFHCLNFLLHLGVVLSIFAVGKLLFRRLKLLGDDEARERAALVGALIFAAHPFCTEAVNYAACATIQMVTLFSMLASYHVLRFLESPSRRSMVAGILLIMLAAFAKDPGIFHVGINVGLLCLVLADRSWVGRAKTWLKEKSLSAGIALGILTSGTLYFIVSKWVGVVSSVVSTYGMEYVGHFLTQGRMLWGYLGRMILPIHLHSDHHIAVSRSAGDDPMAVTALAAVVILCALVAIGLFRKKTRAACLLASLVLGHLVLRFAYPIYEHFVEYRAYPSLPWVGLIGGLGFGMLYAIKQKPAILTALGVVVIGCAASATRSALWSNSQMLANDSSLAYELNNRPRCNLQTIAYQSGNYEEVLTIADAIHDAYGKLIAFNQNNPQKREYDPNRALDDLLMCEQMKTYAIAELEGSKAGIKFANERIGHYRKNLSPGRRLSRDQEEEVEKALESLLMARKVLTEVGDEYDRRKQEQKRLTAQSEAPVADEK